MSVEVGFLLEWTCAFYPLVINCNKQTNTQITVTKDQGLDPGGHFLDPDEEDKKKQLSLRKKSLVIQAQIGVYKLPLFMI